MAPLPKMVPLTSTVQILKAAIFHTNAFKLSIEINDDKSTAATTRSFPKVLYKVCQIRKKNVIFASYNRLQIDALEEARQAFNAVIFDFGFHQKLEQRNSDN